ncbi:VCBS repeat-containing protein [Pelagibius marinus]|uniref:VCBS repeat-containing protein n=1 Tax=Pelagibius marinus TaxID=2762760 RepID=UPI0018731871|nr:VCBS repeat-containing protein [Pelagibius marinus]
MPCRTPSRPSPCASKVLFAGLALLGAALFWAPPDGAAAASIKSLEALGFRPLFTEPSSRVKVEVRRTARPENALPDGQPALAAGGGWGRIAEAWLIDPTERYDHGVLGDAVEAGGLLLRLTDGSERRLLLPEDQVFEDLTPRLADLDRDGEPEVLLVRSSLDHGAVLTAYGLVGEDLKLIAEGPQNLTAHRWLNPIGAADFDGDGQIEVAYVETPHIGGILRIVSLQGDKLVEEASWAGFSNHLIGTRELGLSAILDFDEDGLPEIFLPSARRRSLRVMRYQDGELKLLGRSFYDAQIIGDFRLEDLDGNGMDEVIFQLDDGLEVRLYR